MKSDRERFEALAKLLNELESSAGDIYVNEDHRPYYGIHTGFRDDGTRLWVLFDEVSVSWVVEESEAVEEVEVED